MHVSVPLVTLVCTTCVPAVPGDQKRAVYYPEAAVTDGCELPLVFWESDPGLLEKRPVLLTAELFL